MITESNQLSHFDVADQATLFVFACFGEDSKTRDGWHWFKVLFKSLTFSHNTHYSWVQSKLFESLIVDYCFFFTSVRMLKTLKSYVVSGLSWTTERYECNHRPYTMMNALPFPSYPVWSAPRKDVSESHAETFQQVQAHSPTRAAQEVDIYFTCIHTSTILSRYHPAGYFPMTSSKPLWVTGQGSYWPTICFQDGPL